MQLFAISCGVLPQTAVPVADALRHCASGYPSLAASELVQGTAGAARMRYAAISHPGPMVSPRRYRARQGDHLVLYDGLPIDRFATFSAHHAGELLARWHELHDVLEGVFCAVRIDTAAGRVECLTDVLGMAHVYLHERPSGWVLGNSLEAVAAAAGLSSPDPVGAASLMTLGWPICGSTLVEGVRLLPGGHVHTLDDRGVRARGHFTPATVVPRRQAPPAAAPDVARSMARTTAAAAQGIAPLVCGVTAGRDTRVLLALAQAADWDASYYTSGHEKDFDVRFARRLTSAFDLPYELVTPPMAATEDAWLDSTRRFVVQTDGAATLQSIDDWIDHQQPVAHLGLKLWGPGGEIGRAGNIGLAIPVVANAWGLRWFAAPQRLVLRHKVRGWGLFRPAAVDAAREALDRFADARLQEGWRSREILEAYYGFERVAHWASGGVRRASSATDIFSPFVSRDYITWCFSLSSGERVVEAPHWRLLSELSPALRDMEFEFPWRPQRPRAAQAMVLRDFARDGANKVAGRLRPDPAGDPKRHKYGARWLETGRALHRELCMSQDASPLWEFVDRRALETALSTPVEQMPGGRYWVAVCNAVTAFWWFHGREAPASDRAPLPLAA
jgi:asparagine synthase (glutamine-hydrolysing)